MGRVVMMGGSGCALPFLIVMNLLWGWVFLKPLHWLLLEALLIFLFILQARHMARMILKDAPPQQGPSKTKGVIDVTGEDVSDRPAPGRIGKKNLD